MGKRAAARPRTPGLLPGQFAVRVPLPAAVNVPDLIFERIAANALSDVVVISYTLPHLSFNGALAV